jgi:hypothetical protein
MHSCAMYLQTKLEVLFIYDLLLGAKFLDLRFVNGLCLVFWVGVELP